jgi:hypothetical protein
LKKEKKMKHLRKATLLAVVIAMTFVVVSPSARAQQAHTDKTHAAAATANAKPVTWDTFVRAESDKYFHSYAHAAGIGRLLNARKPTPIDQQKVVRMNRDTLYSIGVFDLTTPLTITMPDTGDRFQSLQVINQDEYVPIPVAYKPGKYTLTQEKAGTRYVVIGIRTFANANDPADVKKVNAIQDQIKVEQASKGKFEIPNWDQKSQDRLRAAIGVLSSTMKNYNKSFGTKEEVDPIAHLGAATGWGGNPAKDATYLNVTPKNNDGKTPYTLTVKDVPVDGFWSISLYNGKGFFVQNKYNAYSINNVTGKKGTEMAASPSISAAIPSSPTICRSWTAGTTSCGSIGRIRRFSTASGNFRRRNR